MTRILVASAERYTREQLRLHLAYAGYEVALAADGIEAGYAILEAWPDLLVCDALMPHMDGVELVAALRSDPAIPPIPVVFLCDARAQEARRRIDGDPCMTKPVPPDRLLSAVKARVRRVALGGPCLAV